MPSPFPGMDPYLEDERLWPAFQHHLVHALHQLLLPGLMDRYRARITQRHYVSEQALFTSVIREEHTEALIEIRQRADGRLVTLLEVISPANKISDAGRQAYLARRHEARSAKANLVEVDLVLQGAALFDYSREGLPAWDYAVFVSRAAQPDRYEIFAASLPKRLPKFRLPLAADDRDTVIDLQAAFARAFDQGDFAKQINYDLDPATKLGDENRDWLRQRLTEQQKR
jgi:predicted transcriptional regulator